MEGTKTTLCVDEGYNACLTILLVSDELRFLLTA
jgi:hypothetical protein